MQQTWKNLIFFTKKLYICWHVTKREEREQGRKEEEPLKEYVNSWLDLLKNHVCRRFLNLWRRYAFSTPAQKFAVGTENLHVTREVDLKKRQRISQICHENASERGEFFAFCCPPPKDKKPKNSLPPSHKKISIAEFFSRLLECTPC